MIYIISLIIFLQIPSSTQGPEMKALSAQFMCPCGCGKVVINCNCGTAIKMQEEIANLLDKGFTPKQIVESYVNQYGESILASPIKKGFNWVGYILPFVVATISILIVIYFIRTQKRLKHVSERKGKDSISDEEKRKIEKELEDME